MRNKSSVLLLIFSLAGFFNAFYLTILYYKNTIPPCDLAKGCESVLNSQFATILGIPIALLGSLYFLTLIILLLLENKASGFFKYFRLLVFSGVVVSIILIFLQAFVLQAFCQYCLLNEAIIFAIFTISLLTFQKKIL